MIAQLNQIARAPSLPILFVVDVVRIRLPPRKKLGYPARLKCSLPVNEWKRRNGKKYKNNYETNFKDNSTITFYCPPIGHDIEQTNQPVEWM